VYGRVVPSYLHLNLFGVDAVQVKSFSESFFVNMHRFPLKLYLSVFFQRNTYSNIGMYLIHAELYNHTF